MMRILLLRPNNIYDDSPQTPLISCHCTYLHVRSIHYIYIDTYISLSLSAVVLCVYIYIQIPFVWHTTSPDPVSITFQAGRLSIEGRSATSTRTKNLRINTNSNVRFNLGYTMPALALLHHELCYRCYYACCVSRRCCKSDGYSEGLDS